MWALPSSSSSYSSSSATESRGHVFSSENSKNVNHFCFEQFRSFGQPNMLLNHCVSVLEVPLWSGPVYNMLDVSQSHSQTVPASSLGTRLGMNLHFTTILVDLVHEQIA